MFLTELRKASFTCLFLSVLKKGFNIGEMERIRRKITLLITTSFLDEDAANISDGDNNHVGITSGEGLLPLLGRGKS